MAHTKKPDDDPVDDRLNPLMEMRRCVGTDTTVNHFFNEVRRLEDARARGKALMVGFTLDEDDVSRLSGGMKRHFKWMWEAGNFILTHDGKIDHFL